MHERLVLAVLDALDLLLVGHLGVELLVLVDVALFLDLGRVGDAGKVLLVLLLKLGEVLLIVHLGLLALGHAARLDGVQVVGVEVGLEVVLGVGDELVDLGLVGRLDLLGLFDLGLVAVDEPGLVVLGEQTVGLGRVDVALELHDLGGAIGTQGVDLLLDGAHVLVDRLEKLRLLVQR